MPLTSAGYTPRTSDDYIAEFRAFFESKVGAVDWSHHTFLSQVGASLGAHLAAIDQGVKAVYDARDPVNATGISLKNLAACRGISPDPGEYSTANVTMYAWPSGAVTVDAGKELASGQGDTEVRWIVTTATVISASGNAAVPVRSKERGSFLVAPLAINRMITPIAGITILSNVAASSPGYAADDDSALRERLAEEDYSNGSRSANAIRQGLVAIDGVTAAIVLENTQRYETSVDGIWLPPGSMAAVVHPSTMSTATRQAVISFLYANAPQGIQLMGPATTGSTGIAATVLGSDGIQKSVKAYFATAVTVTVAVAVTAFDAGYVLADVSDAVEEAITAYFATLSVGEEVRRLDVMAAIAAVPGVAAVTLTLNGSGSLDVDVTSVQYATPGTITVT